jgi:glycosyltransferase involved in cell wall biosynthesis
VRKGHEVTLFTSGYPGSGDYENKDGVEIVRKGNCLSVYVQAPVYFRAQRKRGTQYDIIVDAMNTIPFFSTLYTQRANVLALVYQLTGQIFLKQFMHPIGHMLYALERHSYVPWLLQRADRVVTLSNSNKSELKEAFPTLPPEKIAVIPPGVDHANFKPGEKSKEPLLLFLNRLVRYKQPEHVIEGMKRVCRDVSDAKLLMVGTPPNAKYSVSLQKLVSSLGLGEKVSFRLQRPFSSDKIELLQRAWIHVLPSVKEGFGLSILESAACGTPTVGYAVSGVRDATVHGETGLLAPPGDKDALANHMTDLLSDATKLKLFGEHASKWATNFPWDLTAERFSDAMKCG